MCAWALPALAHDVISTKLTFTQEVSRILYKHCAGCHRSGGTAPMPLLTYDEVRPWAKAIKEEVLERRMPPGAAVKGFGDFRDDPSLTAEEIHTLADWVEGGAPEGDAAYLPDPPRPTLSPGKLRQGSVPPLLMGDGYRVSAAMAVGVIRAVGLAKGDSMQVVAELPDGGREPLLWLYAYDPRFAMTYRYRRPVRLPAGSRIRIQGRGSVRIGP